jgi:hypothetical protein
LLDLPTLYRYRGEVVSLDSARLLTRGNPLGAAGFMSYFNPIRHIYSAIQPENGMSVIGGITHTGSDSYARLLYLAPVGELLNPSLPPLIDNLVAEAGKWGAFHVLADTDEDSQAFVALRRAGFSVYAWQRIWDVSNLSGTFSSGWQRMASTHLPAVQSLYHQIVPPLLQPVEPTPKRVVGLICADGVRCYVNLFYGVYGIVLNPLIHPEATDVGAKLSALVASLPSRRGRPVYLCVRSYQTWLEPVLEDLGAKAGERQAVMVKHLARMIKDEQTVRAKQPAGVVPASRVSHLKEHKS